MSEIISYYETIAERDRLFSGSGMLELERSQEIIQRRIPSPPARVLDIGGGPGVYAGWLKLLGYEVHLLDLAEKHVQQAAELTLASARVGDARELPYENGFADAVLLQGPLYHLTEEADRVQALREAHRVLKPNAPVFAAAISRYASLFHALVDGFVDDAVFSTILDRDLAEGQHRNETDNMVYFTTAAFHLPDQLRGELEQAGFTDVEVFAVEGPGWLAKDFDARWQDPPRRARLLELIRKVERDPAILGASLHLLAVGVTHRGL